jgi:hypothetical protein
MGLPSGRPAREAFGGRDPGGFLREEVHTDLQEGVCTFLGRDIFGEASANYLIGCPLSEKVASGISGFSTGFFYS